MKTAICTCIKNEHSYLKEWMDWHLALGISHIFLYEDYGSKSHADIVKDYDHVTLLPISIAENEPDTPEKRQHKAYTYSLRTLKGEYDWVALIDADEFVEFEEGYDLERLLREYNEHTGIVLTWKLFGANGRISKPTGSVVENYPVASTDIDYGPIWFGPAWSAKCFANLNQDCRLKNIHQIYGAVGMDGSVYPGYKVFKKAWIRHYYTKSWEEWVWRIMERGDLCNGNRKLAQFFNANPDMLPMKEQLIKSVAHRIPHGNKCYILDEGNMIIAGGNIHKIMEINKRIKNESERH